MVVATGREQPYTAIVSKPARPGLKFETFPDLWADVDQLRGGYEKAGHWDLGMMLDHIAKMMSAPFDTGLRNPPWPATAVARLFVQQMVRHRWYPTIMAFPAPPSFRPTRDVDVSSARLNLRAVVDRVEALPDGPVHCPPFGKLSKRDFVGLQLLHAAHHLSFLRPTTG